MESLNWEETLLFIKKSVPEILRDSIDETSVEFLLESAEILASGLLALKLVDENILLAGAKVAAALFQLACKLYGIIIMIIRKESHAQLKNKYEKFAGFIEELKSEIEIDFKAIKELVEDIKKQAWKITEIEKDKLSAFIDDLSFRVQLIDVDIEGCDGEIKLALKKIEDFSKSVKDANDKDALKLIIKTIGGGVAVGIASVAILPLALPVAGVVAGVTALGLANYSGYQERSEERDQFQSDLEIKKIDFEKLMEFLKIWKTTIESYAKVAEGQRKRAA